MTLEVGDHIEVVSDFHGCIKGNAVVLRIKNETCNDHGCLYLDYRLEDGANWYTCTNAIKINKAKMTNLKEKFNSLFLKEPQKSFRAVGMTDDSDKLTEEGKAVFLAWLFSKKADEFKVEVVDKILEAENPSTTGKTA